VIDGLICKKMEKFYNITSISLNDDLFKVTLYVDGIEVKEYIVHQENLDKLIEKIETDWYEYDEYEDDDYDILEFRDQWNDCDDD
jgi:hypothetical protein